MSVQISIKVHFINQIHFDSLFHHFWTHMHLNFIIFLFAFNAICFLDFLLNNCLNHDSFHNDDRTSILCKCILYVQTYDIYDIVCFFQRIHFDTFWISSEILDQVCNWSFHQLSLQLLMKKISFLFKSHCVMMWLAECSTWNKIKCSFELIWWWNFCISSIQWYFYFMY